MSPIPNLTNIQPWQYRIPQQLIGQQPDPYGQLAQALTGGVGQMATMQEQQRLIEEQKKKDAADTLFKVLSSGNVPAQPTQLMGGGQMADINQIIRQDPSMIQKPVTAAQQPTTPTTGYIPTPQLQGQGIGGIAPKPETKVDPFSLFMKKEDYKKKVKDDDLAAMESNVGWQKLAHDIATYKTPMPTMGGMGGAERLKINAMLYKMVKENNPDYDNTQYSVAVAFDRNISTQKVKTAIPAARQEMTKLEELSDAYTRADIPLLNKIFISLGLETGGDPAATWKTAMGLFADNLSMILGGGVITDARLDIALGAIRTADTASQVRARLDLIRSFVDYRENALAGRGVGSLPGIKGGTPTGGNSGGGIKVGKAMQKLMEKK